MATGNVKVKINGQKYLVTGVSRSASYKELLFAVAKATKDENNKSSNQEKLPDSAFGEREGKLINISVPSVRNILIE